MAPQSGPPGHPHSVEVVSPLDHLLLVLLYTQHHRQYTTLVHITLDEIGIGISPWGSEGCRWDGELGCLCGKAGTSHLCDGSTHSSGCVVNGSNDMAAF